MKDAVMTWLMFRNVILAGFFSGMMFWGTKLAGRHFRAEAYLTVMFLVASAVYIPYSLLRGTFPQFKTAPSIALWGLVIAAVGCTMTNLLGFPQYSKPGIPSAIPFSVAMGVNIAIQLVGALFLFHEGLSVKHAAGIILMLGGMALLKP
jgi:hypothetical protein